MVCWTRVKRGQTKEQRGVQVKTALQKLDKLLSSMKVTAKIGPQGAIAFTGWSDIDRDDVTDVCAYRYIMATGSATAKMAIARAEQLAGRGVSKEAIAQGTHSHDGGATWNKGH